MENNSSISPEALALTALAVEYCKAVENAGNTEAHEFLSGMLRSLPRIYIMLFDLKPYGEETDDFESLNTDAIPPVMREEEYADAVNVMSALFGEYDTFLDTSVEDMQYSDTPVARSLAELLADILQVMMDFAAAMKDTDDFSQADVLAELKYRFHSYLSEIICTALRTANMLFQEQKLKDYE
ncbi:MAG: DUF5063 domain-containing protein [Muribaculaceae bacterium]|nr:DUF5063 domain-containing protein [Muribaculaceae bacterium]